MGSNGNGCLAKVSEVGEPKMNLKAYNGRVVCAWLSECCKKLSQANPRNDELKLVAACMTLS